MMCFLLQLNCVLIAVKVSGALLTVAKANDATKSAGLRRLE